MTAGTRLAAVPEAVVASRFPPLVMEKEGAPRLADGTKISYLVKVR